MRTGWLRHESVVYIHIIPGTWVQQYVPVLSQETWSRARQADFLLPSVRAKAHVLLLRFLILVPQEGDVFHSTTAVLVHNEWYLGAQVSHRKGVNFLKSFLGHWLRRLGELSVFFNCIFQAELSRAVSFFFFFFLSSPHRFLIFALLFDLLPTIK